MTLWNVYPNSPSNRSTKKAVGVVVVGGGGDAIEGISYFRSLVFLRSAQVRRLFHKTHNFSWGGRWGRVGWDGGQLRHCCVRCR